MTLTPEQLEKARRIRDKHEGTGGKVEPEWYTIAEFGRYYGYEGVRAVLNNEIDADVFGQLLAAARAIRASELKDLSQAVFIATVSAQAGKKATQTFNKLAKAYDKVAKI